MRDTLDLCMPTRPAISVTPNSGSSMLKVSSTFSGPLETPLDPGHFHRCGGFGRRSPFLDEPTVIRYLSAHGEHQAQAAGGDYEPQHEAEDEGTYTCAANAGEIGRHADGGECSGHQERCGQVKVLA